MEKKYYYKKRFENEIENPKFLSEIKAFNDDSNIQITDFKSDWIWFSEFQNNKNNKKK